MRISVTGGDGFLGRATMAAVATVLRRELPHDLRAEVVHHADRLRTLLRESS